MKTFNEWKDSRAKEQARNDLKNGVPLDKPRTVGDLWDVDQIRKNIKKPLASSPKPTKGSRADLDRIGDKLRSLKSQIKKI